MFKSYLKIALRNAMKYKGYSFINIFGLAIGIASCLIISLYVLDELRFDRFHERADRIYRVVIEKFEPDGATSRTWAPASPGYGPKLQAAFPDQIIRSARFWLWSNPVLSVGDKKFVEERFAYVEPEIFDIFTLPFISGDPATALHEPNSMVMSSSAAKKYFGNADPIGKSVAFHSGNTTAAYRVVGVIRDVPQNSHLRFDVLVPFADWESRIVSEYNVDIEAVMGFLGGDYNYPTYLKLAEGVQPAQLAEQFPAFLDRNMSENQGRKASDIFKIHLQPLKRIYLHSGFDSDYATTGDITYVYIFSTVALLVLLVACSNFVNLSTARSARRAGEVGMRKVFGAARSQLMRQFLNESVLYAGIALLLALVLVDAVLPFFNNFSDKKLAFDFLGNPALLTGLLAMMFFIGLIAGGYPALILSSFRPIRALAGGQQSGRGRLAFRSVLVVFQFAISIALLISVGVVEQQLHFVFDKNLGFSKEQIVSLPASTEIIARLESVKHELQQNPGILSVAASSRVPSGFLNDAQEARVFHDGEASQVGFRLPFVRIDHDFFETYGMQVIAGRAFSRDFPSDSTQAFVLNETAVAQLGWSSPEKAIGQPFGYGRQHGQVIGVVKDFHFESMHQAIKPMLFELSPYLRRISIRMRSENVAETLAFLQQKWLSWRPDYPFDYYFIDERFEQRYGAEQKLGQVFGLFAGLAAFVACLGLLGLISYSAEQRTKEIGVRKVLGASVASVTALLSRDFVKLVLLANVLAWPLAWLAMHRWLENFAYRVEIGWWVFALAGTLALIIALLTVSTQAIRAALVNPVESLRCE